MLSAIAALILACFLPPGLHQKFVNLLAPIKGWVTFVEPAATALGLEQNEPVLFFLTGGTLGALSCYFVVRTIYPRFFEEFDDTMLHPLCRARSYDALWGAGIGEDDAFALPFLLPEDGQRRDAWERLREMLNTGLELAEQARKGSIEQKAMFGWGLLVGPSCSGKSRLAVELARTLNLQSSRDNPAEDREPEKKFWKRRAAKIRTWWRVQVRRIRPKGGEHRGQLPRRPGHATRAGRSLASARGYGLKPPSVASPPPGQGRPLSILSASKPSGSLKGPAPPGALAPRLKTF